MHRTGTDGSDTLIGSKGNDELYGRGGDDWLQGGAGNDELFGNAGNDLLEGGRGNDILRGGAGNDTLLGGLGNDRLLGGADDDVMSGDEGDDTLTGGAGNDRLSGGDGLDTAVFSGSLANYTFTRVSETEVLVTDLRADGDGADVLQVDIERIRFTDGTFSLGDLTPPWNPVFWGTEFDDFIFGSESSDEFRAGAGNDEILGFGGDDVIEAGTGDDHVAGGDGHDTLVLSGLALDYDIQFIGEMGFVVTDRRAGGDGVDTIRDVETLQFADGQTFSLASLILTPTEGDDTLNGSDLGEMIDALGGNDTVDGRGGDDTLFGGDGDDVLIGGEGRDLIVGGAGNDTIIADWDDIVAGDDGYDTLVINSGSYGDLVLGDRNGLEKVDISGGQGIGIVDAQLVSTDMILNGGDGSQILIGGSGNDTISGGAGQDSLVGGAGDDTLIADWFDTSVIGGDGYDTLSFAGSEGGIFEVSAGAGIEEIHSTLGGGSIVALKSDVGVTLVGNEGRDYLYGSAFDDTLIEGGGADVMFGGAGADRFVFGQTLEIDEIRDFETGVDKIDLSALGTSYDQLEFGTYGGSSYFTIQGVGSVVFNNGALLSETDFVF